MFRLPIFLIALLHKPQRSHRYACVCEAALSEKYSAPNIKVFSAGYTSGMKKQQMQVRSYLVIKADSFYYKVWSFFIYILTSNIKCVMFILRQT